MLGKLKRGLSRKYLNKPNFEIILEEKKVKKKTMTPGGKRVLRVRSSGKMNYM